MRPRPILLGALALALAVACGPRSGAPGRPGAAAWEADLLADPEALPPAPPPVSLGERMTYRVTMHELDVATFSIVVGDLDRLDGREVVVVQSEIRSSPLVSMVRKVEDVFTSWIDAATGRPVLFRASELATPEDQQVEGSDSEVARLEDGGFPVRVRRDGGELVERQAVGAHPLFDMNGFLMRMRGWDVPDGATATADVIRSRFLWRTQITMRGHESVSIALGELPAVRIEGVSRRVGRDGELDPKSDARRYTLWISDDADRVPLLMLAHTDYGDVRLELADYRPGSRWLGP